MAKTEYETLENPLSGEELERVAELARERCAIRKKIEKAEALIKERTAPHKMRIEEIDETIRPFLERVRDGKGKANIKAGPGSFYFTNTQQVKEEDRFALEEAIKRGEVSFEIFGKTLNSTYAKEWIKDNNPDCPEHEMPAKSIPGVSVKRFAKVSFREKS